MDATPGWPGAPRVYEINTWVWLNELGQKAGRRVTLGAVASAELERLADYGFDALWLMGVWTRSPGARRVAQGHPDLQAGYRQALPDYTAEDIVGSPYAIYDYRVDPVLGGDEGLAQLRRRLHALGLRLILDFVPNHLAVDHPWLSEYPERLLMGDHARLAREPGNYFAGHGRIFAHGRDPHFGGWTDTAQLDYRRPETRQAMMGLLAAVAGRCDGVRCDMAMLVTHDIFLRTWGGTFDPPGTEFWLEAIAQVKARYPDFLMLAEAYWDTEWLLQQQGFDYTYDKRLYDRLLDGDAAGVRRHLAADLNFQRHLARFIENHDEARAMAAFGAERVRAAVTLTFTLPGLRLLHEGQLQGRRVRLPVQLARRWPEPPDPELEVFYRRLLKALHHPVFHNGAWRLLAPQQAWAGNPSHHQLIVHRWVLGEAYRLIIVNLAPHPAPCHVALDLFEPLGRPRRLRDLLDDTLYPEDGRQWSERGLYLELPGYGCRLLALESV